MNEPPTHLLEGLSSIEGQRRYVIGGTKDEYLVPEDLMEDAYCFCERAARPDMWINLTPSQRHAVDCLREALAPDILEGYNRSTLVDLIETDVRWALARNLAGKTLRTFGIEPPT